MHLTRQFLRSCRKSLLRPKVADSAGQELTGGQLLMRTLILKRLLARHVLSPDETIVGVLLPPSVGGVIANAALALLGKVPANLNYTASSETNNACLRQASIRHVLTSRLFLSRVKMALDAELVCLEDLRDKVTWRDKLAGALWAFGVPVLILERMLGLLKRRAEDLFAIIFTSGSTGEPKGVMLSQQNVGSNVAAVGEMFQLKQTDVLLGVLPFFHSFGFTGTLWTVLALAPKGVYHYNPLDARVIGDLCSKHRGTIIMATPTFLRTYLKRCDKEQLQSLDLVVVGAEKMPLDLAAAFEEKFGVRPVEGYGTTELSPIAAVNIPAHRASPNVRAGVKEGTVGRPIPGTAARTIDPDTGADLGVDQPGLLLIKGPNVMLGYLHQPQKTAEVLRDGWYITGDIARIDADGFIAITDRASRFSKIGGEMVPHLKIEEILHQILATGDPDDHELRVVVTSVPDPRKGERLVVLHKPMPKTVDQVTAELNAKGLPNLWLPARDSFLEVAEIPLLGTGKLDLKRVKSLAMQHFAAVQSAEGARADA